jgi:hypothetical protein
MRQGMTMTSFETAKRSDRAAVAVPVARDELSDAVLLRVGWVLEERNYAGTGTAKELRRLFYHYHYHHLSLCEILRDERKSTRVILATTTDDWT